MMKEEIEQEDSSIISLCGTYWEFNEIPTNPESTNFWLLKPNLALWYTTYDNKWRFLLMNFGSHSRRSGECFDTKHDAKVHYESGKSLTWIKSDLRE